MIERSKHRKSAAKHFPMHLRLYQVTTLLVATAAIMFATGLFVAGMMNNVRSYVRGENLWAKAQKESVLALYKYAYTGEPSYLHASREFLSVNLGDQKARQALQSVPPDTVAASEGFLQGENHPDDIPGMISLFINYQNISYLKSAIRIWSEADLLIADLRLLADQLEQAVNNNHPDVVAVLVTQLDRLNHELKEKEFAFSSTLGEASRWIKSTLIVVYSVLFILLLIVSVLIARNIARQLRATEEKLRISDHRFTSLARSDLVGIFEFELGGKIIEANRKFLSMLGLHKDDLDGQPLNWQTLTVAEDRDLDQKAAQELRAQGACDPYDKQLWHVDGHKVPVYVGAVLLNEQQETGLAFVIDQTEKYQMEQELRLSAIVMSHSQDAIVILDEQQKVMSANQAFCELAVCDIEKVIGRKFDIINDTMDEEERLAIRDSLEHKENWEGDIDFKNTVNELIPVRLSISIIQDEQHDYGQYVYMLSDIKARKEAEERLQYLASFDTLTGIANRITFQSRLNRAISRAKRHDKECAILFIDLNKFKPVNDHHGHEVGDELLKQVAERLKALVRSVDTAARIGGDEFVVILEDIEDRAIIHTVVKRIIEAVAEPYEVKALEINISCSVGISVYPHDGSNDVELTRSADIAMYAAKSMGESQYYFFNRRLG